EGKPGGEFEVVQSEFCVSWFSLRPTDRAIEELRADQNCRDDLLDSLVEGAASLAFGFVERHEALQVFLRHRPAEGTPAQVFGDLFRANRLAGFLRLANEYQIAAGRSRNACWVERSGDLDAVAKMDHAVGGGLAAG